MPKRGKGKTRIREVRAASDPAFRPAHRLLAASLPAGEVVSIREWRHTLAERSAGVWADQCWHLLVAERGGRVLGMTSGTYLGSLNIGMIGYLVLHPLLRKQGIGPRLRNRLRERFERDALAERGGALTAIVGEVDAANPWLLNLMRRAGALALDLVYYQPSLRADDTPSPLVLYYQPLTRPRKSLPVDEVRRLIYAIWRRLYRIAKPLQRPAFRLMLRSLRGRRRIASLAPS